MGRHHLVAQEEAGRGRWCLSGECVYVCVCVRACVYVREGARHQGMVGRGGAHVPEVFIVSW